MIGGILLKSEYFEIENDFIENHKIQTCREEIFLPIHQSIHQGILDIRNNNKNIESGNILGISKGEISESLFDIIYPRNHISNLSEEIIEKMKSFYIGKIFGIIFLDFQFYSERQLYNCLQKIKGQMSYESPESASGMRKEALMLYLNKKNGYVTGNDLPGNWRETGNFFHVPDNEQETTDIYEYINKNGNVINSMKKTKIKVRNALVDKPPMFNADIESWDISQVLDFFDNDIVLTSDLTEQQLSIIMKYFPIEDYKNILDLGCGKGRISNCLASEGYNVTGFDNNHQAIEKAQENSNPYNRPKFINLDFSGKDISEYKNKFNGVIYIYDSGLDLESLKIFLQNSNLVLKDGGRVLFDFLNLDNLKDSHSNTDLLKKYSLNNLGIKKAFRKRTLNGEIEETIYEILSDNGGEKTFRYEHHLYKKELLSKLFKEYGFEIEFIYGDYKESEFTSQSNRLIFIANKKSQIYRKTHETQGQKDNRDIVINKVGIKNVATSFKIPVFGGVNLHGKLTCSAYLPADKKGTHMSRMSLLNTKIFDREINMKTFKKVMSELYNSLGTQKVFLEIDGECIREKKSPITKLGGHESFNIKFFLEFDGENLSLEGELGIYGMSLCPASKKNSQYGAHNQRSKIVLRFPISDNLNIIEKYISSIEESFSCEVYPTLKIEDEIFVTEKSYENPKFVEDIIRDCVLILKNKNLPFYYIEVENYESIHTHDAFAKIFNNDI